MKPLPSFAAGAGVVAVACALVVGALPTVSAEREAPVATTLPDFTRVVEKAGPAVVAIQVEQRSAVRMPRFMPGSPLDDFFRRFGTPAPRRRSGQGSGVIVDPHGHVLTNAHVVAGATRIRVHLHDGRAVRGELIGADPQSDLAVIKIDPQGTTPALLGDSDALRVGEWVVAIGTPFGLQQTVTSGIVSAKGRSSVGIVDHEDFIQTDAAINPGNSGGPLLNLRGEVVGINSAIFSRSGGNVGIAFSIPSAIAEHVLRQLTQDGTVSRGYLGVVVQDLTPDLADGMGLQERRGAVVSEVQSGSAADRAGLAVGDVILSMDGQRIRSSAALRNTVSLMRPGHTISIDIVRDGAKLTLPAELGTRPANRRTTAAPTPRSDVTPTLGLTLAPLTEQLAKRIGLASSNGVLVASVQPGSVAHDAGLRSGALILAINRTSFDDAQQAMAALAQAPAGSKVVLRVRQGQGTRFVVLTVPE